MTVVQICLGLLDLIGVVLIGALGALSIQGIEARPPGDRVLKVLHFFGLSTSTLQMQITFLGIVAASTMLLKTFLSIMFSRRTIHFLTAKGAEISSTLVSKILSEDLSGMESRPSQETLYMISSGVINLTNGVLASTVSVISDSSMLLILSLGLFLSDPIVALATFMIFFTLVLILHVLLDVRAMEIGIANRDLEIAGNEKILEVLNTYREAVVKNRRQHYVNEIRAIRYRLSSGIAEASFQPYISKYVIETATVLGGLGLAAFEFGTKNAVHAVSTLSIFLAASSRIAPAALRIQQGTLLIKNHSGAGETTLVTLEKFKGHVAEESDLREPLFDYPDFNPVVEVKNLCFSFDPKSKFSIENVSFEIPPGKLIALVGSSGAGKSTLADLILGVLKPDSGSVEISGLDPLRISERWPGSIAYVPQEVSIVSGTVRENVALSYSREVAKTERVLKALKGAQLFEEVQSLPEGIDSNVGENGTQLSGGQRQRLGIARALFTLPKLIVMDEATSALDGLTEDLVSKAISNLSGETTLIIIAHRLSTVLNADLVIYMEKGRVVSTGTFSEVREAVPNFDAQASLMGL
jgi:ABC-type multidrug transport system fused ATPase/permease subunit